jgi:glycosyltransferase 2 family protein
VKNEKAVQGSVQTAPASGLRLNDGRLWLSLGLAVLLMAVFALRLDFDSLWDEVKNAEWGWVVAAVAANLAAQGFRAVRQHILLLPTRRVPTAPLLGAVLIGSALNNVLPLRGGSVARVQIIARRFDINRSTLAATLAAELFLDTLVISVFLMVGISVLHLGLLLGTLATVVLVASLTFFALAWWLNRALRHGLEVVEQKLAFIPEGPRQLISSGLLSFEQGFWAFWRAHHALPLLAASAAVWLSESVSFYFFGLAVGLDLSFMAYVTLVALADIATSLAFTPAGLGAFELSVSELLRQLGTTSAEAGAYVLMSHAILALSVMLAALVALLAMKVRATDIFYLRRLPLEAKAGGGG